MPYWPGGYQAIHEVRSWLKVRQIVRAVERGYPIPPYLVDGEHGNGNLLTGTHRAAANDLLSRRRGARLIDEVALDDLDADDRTAILEAAESDHAEIERLLAERGYDAR